MWFVWLDSKFGMADWTAMILGEKDDTLRRAIKLCNDSNELIRYTTAAVYNLINQKI